MLIQVRHVSTYSFEPAARYAINSVRLTPPSFDAQKVLAWRIEAEGIETAAQFRDGYGNICHTIAVASAHDTLEIVASGLVETTDLAGVARGVPEVSPTRVFLRETEQTKPDARLKELAASVKGRDRLDLLHGLMAAVAQAVVYEIGATHAHTTAVEALAEGKGVCQDHAHVFIAAARLHGIPARYVNGYFLNWGAEVSEAHHAWAEAHVDGLGWVGFDPANRVCPTDRYVRLACGLDALSAAPIRGNRRGGEQQKLDVVVEVQQQSAQQQQ